MKYKFTFNKNAYCLTKAVDTGFAKISHLSDAERMALFVYEILLLGRGTPHQYDTSFQCLRDIEISKQQSLGETSVTLVFNEAALNSTDAIRKREDSLTNQPHTSSLTEERLSKLNGLTRSYLDEIEKLYDFRDTEIIVSESKSPELIQ